MPRAVAYHQLRDQIARSRQPHAGKVEPGTVVQGTSIRVDMAEGADTAMASDLVEVLTQRGLVERAVAEPDALVRASADYLRTVGYVDPKVRVSPPTFDGTRADVRVQVDPGVLLRLGRVRFAGMRGVPVADLEMSAALATGAPYEVSVRSEEHTSELQSH